MSRYPYTEAYDALRSKTEYKPDHGLTFSRSEAAQVVKYIAEAIGMDNELLACMIADYARQQENRS